MTPASAIEQQAGDAPVGVAGPAVDRRVDQLGVASSAAPITLV